MATRTVMTPRKLTERELVYLLDSGGASCLAAKRLEVLESLLAEVEEQMGLREFESSGYTHVRCQLCAESWLFGEAGIHKPDCLYIKLRQAVQP